MSRKPATFHALGYTVRISDLGIEAWSEGGKHRICESWRGVLSLLGAQWCEGCGKPAVQCDSWPCHHRRSALDGKPVRYERNPRDGMWVATMLDGQVVGTGSCEEHAYRRLCAAYQVHQTEQIIDDYVASRAGGEE